MPYVEVWVDESDVCGPCEECAERDRQEDDLVSEIVREWYFRKSRGDYEGFEEFLNSQAREECRAVVFGKPEFVPVR